MKTSIISQLGYTWLALPREDVLPLTLLEKQEEGFFKRISNSIFGVADSAEILPCTIFDLFPKPKKGGAIPKRNKARSIPNFTGQDIVESNNGFNLKGKETIWGKNSGGASAKLSNSSKLLYDFKNPKLINVKSPILLEEYLNINKPNENAVGYVEKLKSGKIYIVTEVLQTNNFSVKDASDFQWDGNMEVESMMKKIGQFTADATSQSKDSDSNEMTYSGEESITFAIKAYKIFYHEDKNKFSLSKTALRSVRSDFSLQGESMGDGVIE